MRSLLVQAGLEVILRISITLCDPLRPVLLALFQRILVRLR